MEIAQSLYFRVIVFPILMLNVPSLIWFFVSLVRIIRKKKAAWIHLLISIVFLIDSLFFFGLPEVLTSVQLMKDVGAQSCYVEGRITRIHDGGLYEHGKYQKWIISIESDSEKYFVLAESALPPGLHARIEYLPNSHAITRLTFDGDAIAE